MSRAVLALLVAVTSASDVLLSDELQFASDLVADDECDANDASCRVELLQRRALEKAALVQDEAAARAAFTAATVATHNTPADCWGIFHGHVFAFEDGGSIHPGRPLSTYGVCGTDQTSKFDKEHPLNYLKNKLRYVGGRHLGVLMSSLAEAAATPAAAGEAAQDSAALLEDHKMHKNLKSETCAVGDFVICPGSTVGCAGGQCCPGVGGQTFPCPSAPSGWSQCGSSTKVVDCTGTSLVPPPAPAAPPPAAPAPPPAPARGSRLIVKNACDAPVWIASMIPSEHRDLFPNNVKLNHNEEITFAFPYDKTIASTRFWPKMGCDETGDVCKVGSSGGLGQNCPPEGCAPPVDSKFEATWWDHATAEAVDWWDTSGVDGYTLPYTVEVDETCPRGINLDCRDLKFADCPQNEAIGGKSRSLVLRDPHDGKQLGCYSPCGKLTFSNWRNSPVFAPADKEAQPYCCPTPPISPQQCREGPVEQTEYVKVMRRKCKSVYSYAYDDAVGLQTCPAGTTYRWTVYCPA